MPSSLHLFNTCYEPTNTYNQGSSEHVTMHH